MEVAGVEPASFSFSVGLLRAHPMKGLGTRLAIGTVAGPQLTEMSLSDASATLPR